MNSSVILAESFGRAAARYRDHARVQRALADWTAEWLPALPLRTGRALEVGAGSGLFTERILPWSGPFVATDISPAMCAEGRRHLPEVEWLPAAVENPPAGPWDHIFSSSMLQWVRDPVVALAACRAVLMPGGTIVAGLFAAPTLPQWAEAAGAAPLEWRTPAQWLAALDQAGWRVIRSAVRTDEIEFGSGRELAHSLHAVGAAPARRLTAPRLREILRQYDERNRSPGGVRSTWTFFRFEATR